MSRLDLDVQGGAVKDYRFKLIPLFADAIAPDATMAAQIAKVRAPLQAKLAREIGRTEYAALPPRQSRRHVRRPDLRRAYGGARRRDRAVAGFPLGTSCCRERRSRWKISSTQTAITYPAAYRTTMTGARLKEVLEDVADNLFNPDPYYQQGGDMVRIGGLAYTIDVAKPMGSRISATLR